MISVFVFRVRLILSLSLYSFTPSTSSVKALKLCQGGNDHSVIIELLSVYSCEGNDCTVHHGH